MSVLITGAFGFVGTNLSKHLAGSGFEVWALDVCPGGGTTPAPVPGERGVCPDAGACADAYARRFTWEDLERIPWGSVDAVVHLAGKAHDTRRSCDPRSYFDVNVGLTTRVLAAWARARAQAGGRSDPEGRRRPGASAKAFVLFSSVKAAADRVEGVLTEEAAPDPQTPYGKSKLEAEGEVRRGAGGVRTYILRPCMIHGPGNKGNLNLLYGMVRRGLPWPLGAFDNRRSFASVWNVCAAVEGLLKGGAESGVYQVADDTPLSTNEVVALMAEALGKKPRVWRVPAALIRRLARLGDRARLPLNSERLGKLTQSYVVSNAKLKAALAWERMPVAAREGMRRTLESFG